MRRVILFVLLVALGLVPAALAQEATQEANQAIDVPLTRDVIYTIRPSDTLETIGATYDISPTCIAERNDIAPGEDIFPGETLQLDVDCPLYGEDPRDFGGATVVYPRGESSFVDDCEGYRVRRFDTLDVIGQQLDVSAQAIQQANAIERPSQLEVNTCLIIPDDAPPYGVVPASDALGMGGGAMVDGELYVVQPNDTLDTIGQMMNVSAEAIAQANNITRPSFIRAGDTLVIPADAPPYGTFPATDMLGMGGGAMDIPAGAERHIVQPQQTVDTIAQSYNVSRQCVINANNLERPGFIQPGQTLGIPADCPPYDIYGRGAVQLAPADDADDAANADES